MLETFSARLSGALNKLVYWKVSLPLVFKGPIQTQMFYDSVTDTNGNKRTKPPKCLQCCFQSQQCFTAVPALAVCGLGCSMH